ncbi:MAG TPA: DUF6599 family protein [Candidatus Acidoferrales bacterium]|nr:DUF6599 family protein [Candidatus Acidoferrales bacterium]
MPVLAQGGGQNILPQTFGGWTATSHQAFKAGEQPPANGAAANQAQASAAAREYGLVAGETASYSHGAPGADNGLTATIYRMKDPSGAYGEYSYLRTPDMATADFTDHAAAKANQALVLVGNLVLQIDGINARRDAADIKSLVSAIEPKSENGLYPTLPEHMPDQDRVAHSDHYILGPATLDQFFPGGIGKSLGFSFGPEVETAHFTVDGRDLTMMIADFPTPQIAQAQLDSLSKRFNVNGSQPNTASAALFANRTQTMVAIVAGAQSSDQANKLLDQVQPGSVLTWDQPTFQFKEPRFEVMVVGAFVGTGIICLLTLVGALAFSGFRLTVKKMFPNTLFDRSTQIDILQLGLVSKPIKAEDFYSFDGKRIDTGMVDKNLPDRTALRLFK